MQVNKLMPFNRFYSYAAETKTHEIAFVGMFKQTNRSGSILPHPFLFARSGFGVF